MNDADRNTAPEPHETPTPAPAGPPPAAVFVVAFLTAFAAAGAAFALGGLLGLGVGLAVGFAGSAVVSILAAHAAQTPVTKAAALYDVAIAEDAPSTPPAAYRAEPWASLYREVAGSASSRRTAAMAVLEVERLRRGGDPEPATEPVDERRSWERGVPSSFEPRPSHDESELVGSVPPESEPASGHDVEVMAALPVDTALLIAEAVRPYRDGIASIESDLAVVLDVLRKPPAAGFGDGNGAAAAMVDTLVRTAADGIEDLAAGLMRANELAGVAERVTNRATLLALNAALEATRSGSEAFASIAEETRRLAEYAREATDTISRLSGEIELKVGETIGAIQSTSEDAKAAVAAMSAGRTSPAPVVAAGTADEVASLLERARSLRERLDAATAVEQAPAVEEAPAVGGMSMAAEAEPAEAVEPAPPAESAEPESATPESAEGEATPSAEDLPESMMVTIDAAEENPPAYGDIASLAAPAPGTAPTPGPDPEPAPVQESESGPETRRASAAPSTSGAGAKSEVEGGAPPAPFIEPKIPDWLEGIRPDGPHSS